MNNDHFKPRPDGRAEWREPVNDLEPEYDRIMVVIGWVISAGFFTVAGVAAYFATQVIGKAL